MPTTHRWRIEIVAEQPTALAGEHAAPAMYHERHARFAALRDRYGRSSSRNGNVSVALIGAALLLAGIGLWRDEMLWMAGAGALLFGFVISYGLHGRVDRQHRRYAELAAINAEGLQRIDRDWAALPLRQPPGAPSDHPYAADLDLLGHASLQHLLNTPSTPVGLRTLQDWLLQPATPQAAQERQPAVAELAARIELREEIALRGRLLVGAQHRYERFLSWAESEPWLLRRSWLLWLSRGLTLANLSMIVAAAAGAPVGPALAATLAASFALSLATARPVNAILDEVAVRQSVFEGYSQLFALLADEPFGTPGLRKLQARLSAGGRRADRLMRRLSLIMSLADLRGWMFFIVVQTVTLWSLHVLWLLERWQRDAGKEARGWLETLGELEALEALAALRFENPEWAFPELADARRDAKEGADRIGAESRSPADLVLAADDLGHPLLPDTTRVGNDVTVGPPGTFLLVTGSNMSGKSTLLRAIGVNTALAQIGAPVCAARMRLPPVQLATSMRVRDSLEQGVSYFMAELLQLKRVVEAARAARESGERTVLFLLDEILHGTNTGERQVAARRVIIHLLEQGAIGAVSTHDLTLADAPDLTAAAVPVHFTETFTRGANGPAMRFDYRLRPGLATSSNALKLVELVGLLPDTAGES